MKRLILFAAVALMFSLSVTPILAQIDYCEGNFDYDQDQDGTDAFKFKTDFGRSALKNPCPPDGPAPVPKTGRNTCYDTDGNLRDCAGTGEDGEYQKGVASPNPRFTDHGDGTITDKLTGLMWTKDTQQIPGFMTWQVGLDACNNLDYAGYDDWRLPNVNELLSLIDRGNFNPALPTGHPFINVVLSFYWSSTTGALNQGTAWFVYFGDGYVDYGGKSNGSYYIRAVRSGQ